VKIVAVGRIKLHSIFVLAVLCLPTREVLVKRLSNRRRPEKTMKRELRQVVFN
jgi:hypothetical protein